MITIMNNARGYLKQRGRCVVSVLHIESIKTIQNQINIILKIDNQDIVKLRIHK